MYFSYCMNCVCCSIIGRVCIDIIRNITLMFHSQTQSFKLVAQSILANVCPIVRLSLTPFIFL